MCRALHCGKSHQEWFEVTRERAEQVVGYWADFMKRAQPYDAKGRLKDQWRVVIEMIDRHEEVVTGKRLLYCYEESLVWEMTVVEEASLINEPDDLKQELKVEEVRFGDVPHLGRLESLEKTPVRVGSPLVDDSSLPKKEPLLRTNSLPWKSSLVRRRSVLKLWCKSVLQLRRTLLS
jgi:hypothetical protein